MDPNLFEFFFWQFARSRIDTMDLMRFWTEFVTFDAPNVRVLLNATVTRIDTNQSGSAFEKLEVSTIDGRRSLVRAKSAVLAASAIENPRLLLVSNSIQHSGLGNQYDLVGRFLYGLPGERIGQFKAEDCPAVVKRFGFYSLKHRHSAHMYMHGLVPSKKLQERERLLHCAVYMIEENGLHDPGEAVKRLMRAKNNSDANV